MDLKSLGLTRNKWLEKMWNDLKPFTKLKRWRGAHTQNGREAKTVSPTPTCHSLPRPTGTSEQLRKLWTRWPRNAGRQRPAETAACKVDKRRFLVWDVIFHGVKSSKTLRFHGPSGSQKVLLNPFEPMPRQGALARRCFACFSAVSCDRQRLVGQRGGREDLGDVRG